MKKVPILARTKPLISGMPPILNEHFLFGAEALAIPKRVSKSQKYYAIEVLPPELIDSSDFHILGSDNLSICGFLCSSLFPIWVQATSNNGTERINIQKTYNTFPFPKFNGRQEQALLERVSAVLKARGTSSGNRLSDIYTSGEIPDHLEMAHEDLDEVVLDIFGLPSDATKEQILDKLFSEYLKLLQN